MSFIERFKDATIGFSGYPRLARDRSSAFAFMAVLLLISVAIAGVITTVQTYRLTASMAAGMQRGPDFGLKDGVFYFEGEMPYKVGGADGFFAVIVDTTGKTSPGVLKSEPTNSLLITETTLYQVDAMQNIHSTPLKAIPFEFTRADLVEEVKRVYLWVPGIYLLMYGFQLGFCSINAAILSRVANAYAANFRRKVSRELGLKLAFYAMSLPTLMSWVFPNFRNYTLRGFLLWWGVSLIYLLQGTKACADAGLLDHMDTNSGG